MSLKCVMWQEQFKWLAFHNIALLVACLCSASWLCVFLFIIKELVWPNCILPTVQFKYQMKDQLWMEQRRHLLEKMRAPPDTMTGTALFVSICYACVHAKMPGFALFWPVLPDLTQATKLISKIEPNRTQFNPSAPWSKVVEHGRSRWTRTVL